MTWQSKTSEQRTALKRVSAWLKEKNNKIFYLGGYGGTGKTELARHFAEGVSGMVAFGAFTGKATLVLIKRGCYNARTIHSWLYQTYAKDKQKLVILEKRREELLKFIGNDSTPELVELEKEIAAERERVEQPAWKVNEASELSKASLVILDECSMIDKRMAEDLLSCCKKILVLGDPAQLPPVKGAGYFTNRKPDYLLTEVVRHDNGILDLANKVRNGSMEISFGTVNGDVQKISKRELGLRDYASADQILTGKNISRMRLNVGLRRVLGFDGLYPKAGDKVICLRNSYDHGLVNGQLGIVNSDFGYVDPECITFALKDHVIQDPDRPPDSTDGPTPLSVYAGHFDRYQDPNMKLSGYWDRQEYDEFDYGYAITVHKAQGSQWGHPWICDDGFLEWDPNARRKWLYTAITRAEDKLTIVA